MARIEGKLVATYTKTRSFAEVRDCVERRPIADQEKRSKSAQRPRWVRIAARMVVESASLIGSQSDLRIVDLHHRERLARSAVVADDGKVSDSDRVMFLQRATSRGGGGRILLWSARDNLEWTVASAPNSG